MSVSHWRSLRRGRRCPALPRASLLALEWMERSPGMGSRGDAKAAGASAARRVTGTTGGVGEASEPGRGARAVTLGFLVYPDSVSPPGLSLRAPQVVPSGLLFGASGGGGLSPAALIRFEVEEEEVPQGV